MAVMAVFFQYMLSIFTLWKYIPYKVLSALLVWFIRGGLNTNIGAFVYL